MGDTVEIAETPSDFGRPRTGSVTRSGREGPRGLDLTQQGPRGTSPGVLHSRHEMQRPERWNTGDRPFFIVATGSARPNEETPMMTW